MNPTKYSANVFWSDEDAAFIATSHEFENLSAFGSTPEEAITELQTAISLAVEAYEEEGLPLPAPEKVREFSGQFRLRVPKGLHEWLVNKAQVEEVSLNTLVTSILSQYQGSSQESSHFGMMAASDSWREAFLRASAFVSSGIQGEAYILKEPSLSVWTSDTKSNQISLPQKEYA